MKKCDDLMVHSLCSLAGGFVWGSTGILRQKKTFYNYFLYHSINKKPYGFIDGPFIPQDTQSKKSEYIESARECGCYL